MTVFIRGNRAAHLGTKLYESYYSGRSGRNVGVVQIVQENGRAYARSRYRAVLQLRTNEDHNSSESQRSRIPVTNPSHSRSVSTREPSPRICYLLQSCNLALITYPAVARRN